MKALKQIGRKLTENAGLKILSLIIALLLWIVVISIDNPVMVMNFTAIPLHVENAELMTSQGKAFEIPGNNQTISISVRAERSVLNQLSRDNFYASVDMADLENNTLPVEVRATKYSDRIANITPRTSVIHVTVEDLIRKQIRIRPTTSGEPAEGYTIGNIKADSNVVRVSGPKSIVDRIDHAGVSVDVSGMSSDIRSSEALVLYDDDEETIDDEGLELSIERTTVNVGIYGTKEIEVEISYSGTPAEGYAVSGSPISSINTLTITADDDLLEETEVLKVPESAIDISGAAESVKLTLDLRRYLAASIRIMDEETEAEIEIPIARLNSITVNVPVSNITIENVPEGMRATVTEMGTEVQVPVRGLEQNLVSLNPLTIRGTADVKAIIPPEGEGALVPNVYELPVSFTYPSGVYAGDTPVTIAVLVQVAENPEVTEQLPATEAVGTDILPGSTEESSSQVEAN